jgi:hypothetical protein
MFAFCFPQLNINLTTLIMEIFDYFAIVVLFIVMLYLYKALTSLYYQPTELNLKILAKCPLLMKVNYFLFSL